MTGDLKARLVQIFAKLGLELADPDGPAARLTALTCALAREPAPPTRLTSQDEIADGHIADSLAGLLVPKLAAATSIVDIGSGAGFPGLALAAALPDASVDLVDATAKKVEVIERLARAAGIANARGVADRIETWAAAEGAGAYAAATVRAVAALPVLLEYAAPLLSDGGVLVAWKGARDEDEEAAGRAAGELVGLAPVDVLHVVPYEGAHSRHLHVYEKAGPTPDRFPRRPGVAARKPLA
jgi:16S rRNA (guanine527-N7)-methyltransferase